MSSPPLRLGINVDHVATLRNARGGARPDPVRLALAAIEAFADIVNAAGYASPVRTPRGRDILAACGQLKSDSIRLRKSERDKIAAEV